MDLNYTSSLINDFRKEDLIFAYMGSIADSITHKIIELTHYNIDTGGNFVKLKNKIGFLMAECYQNVARHGKHSIEEMAYGDFNGALYVRSIENNFYIASANTVNSKVVDSIREKLDEVKGLDSSELRILQKEILAKGKLSDRGGAGLGIIEMARKTNQNITYDFVPIDDNNYRFFIQLKLQTENDDSQPDDDDTSLETVKLLHSKMFEENLIILHKGDFSEHSVLPIIHMIEKNVLESEESRQGRQKLYNISVELLQNISMHAVRIDKANEGLFILKKEENHYVIGASNFIEPSSSLTLKNLLQDLEKHSKSELNDLYREKMRELIDEKTVGVGIGLIYIFRKSNSISYSITSQEDKTLYTIIVEV